MFPANPATAPDTRPHAHPSRVKQKKAQTPQTPSRPKGRKQRDNPRQQGTGDQSGGNRSIPTAPGNQRVTVRTHIDPPSRQPDNGGPTPRGQTHTSAHRHLHQSMGLIQGYTAMGNNMLAAGVG
ncbi:Hypothetical predicted protein [Pelobates cultripes]|uniref:Uncharacterized protein n=1 Tax=Pelobates cultripes TaxID=61616 RepID=A0AAD1T4L3_PELCU|nr:Hypothetical predicted protein [Pelobates cultripes]